MTPERWHQVDRLFQAVIELTPEERTSFLDVECPDPELRREVEGMIASDAQGLALVEEPAVQAAAPLLVSSQFDLEVDNEIGRYKILAFLGAGGMGEVYLALDQTLNRKVALKLLPAEYTGNSDWLDRFYREARAASGLNHPNILTIHDIGQVEGLHYIATEFIDGETLRTRLSTAKLDLTEAIDIAIQVGNALGAAHRGGIVHRDIKPENIMLRRDGHVKVVDFGLAKLPSQSNPTAVAAERAIPGRVMGTPKYMSPEQTRGLEEDTRSDIFSFGVVLYEMLEGRPPFEGDSNAALIRSIREEQQAPLKRVPAVSGDELQRIVEKLLQKDKAKRYSTVEVAVADLRAVRNQLGDTSRPVSRLSRFQKISISVALLAALGLAAYVALIGMGEPISPISVIRVTNAENSTNVAISPDGNYLAHASLEPGKESLWLRDLNTDRDVQLIPPGDPIWEPRPYSLPMTISADNRFVYLVPKYSDKDDLYRISISGGAAEKVLSNIASPVSFSPGGMDLAFVRYVTAEETALVISRADGSGERVLIRRKSPEYVSDAGAAWSPDGRIIASTVGTISGSRDIVAVGVQDGSEQLFPPQKWDTVGRLAWSADGKGVVAGAAIKDNLKVWFIPFPTGEPRVLIDQLEDYDSLSLTADSRTLAAVRWKVLTSVYVAPSDKLDQGQLIRSGTQSGFRVVSWTPDGRIVYPSNEGGNRNVWIMNGDGSNPRPLTSRGLLNDVIQLAVSPDGQWVAFGADWSKEGIYNIWKIRIDGSNAVQLTHGNGEILPAWSRDGEWLIYTSGNPNDPRAGDRRLWKIPSDGGTPTQLTNSPSMNPVVSPDGNAIASWYKEGPQSKWRIALLTLDGGTPLRLLPAIREGNGPLRWMPDGSALTYLRNVQGVFNIWRQPIDGSPPQQLTHFTSERINNFDWSRSGVLVCSRATDVGELLLMRNFGLNRTDNQ